VPLGAGEFDRTHDCLRAAETLAQALGDRYRLGWVSLYLCNYFGMTGDLDSATASGQRALALAQTLGNVELQVVAHLFLGRDYYVLGDYRRAIDLLAPNLALLTDGLSRECFGLTGYPAVRFRTWLAWSYAELGEFREAMTVAQEMVRLAEAVDHPFTLAEAYRGIGYVYLRHGAFDKAIPPLERALGLCHDWQYLLLLPAVVSTLSAAYALSGRVAEALSLLRQAEGQVTPTSLAFSMGDVWLSEASLRTGCHAEAMAHARHGLSLSHERKQRGAEAWTLHLLGELHARRDPPEVEHAEDHYRQALAFAEELAMRPLQAHCHLGLGTLYARLARREEARAALSAAIALYRAMEMMFWLPQAEAALSHVG
jgi:tetratricopeptide (TPR) repeat protein